MQFTTSTITAIMVFTALVSAAPSALQTRANSKLNQYSNPSCLDNTGGNVPTYHDAPVDLKCYNIDSTTQSFFWVTGPLSHMHIYAGANCGGLSVDLGKNGGCMSVNVNYSGGFQKILSIKMTA